jgi:hypothetical protein
MRRDGSEGACRRISERNRADLMAYRGGKDVLPRRERDNVSVVIAEVCA